MHLSAIYIEEHFLSEKPIIINLGGTFAFSIEGKSIKKEENKNYIPNFYSQDDGTVTQLSAIVGKNGAGKSSLLKTITEILDANSSRAYHYILFFEEGNNIYTKSNGFDDGSFGYKNNEPQKVSTDTFTTFYYSPYLDFRTESIGDYDLSLDNTVENDLDEIDEIRKSSNKVNPIRHLKMRNWIRQLEFINSKFGKNILENFRIPYSNRNRITFTRYMISVDSNDEIDFHNIPYNFREVFKSLYNKIKKESVEIHERNRSINKLVNIQKDLLKNYFLMDFLCLFIKQMEISNTYLGEGYLKSETNRFLDGHTNSSAIDFFFDFLDKHYYKVRGDEFKLLPIDETINLINTVYQFIDKSKAKNDRDTRNFDWNEQAIYLEKNDAIKLLQLQNDFLNKVDNYYGKEENLKTFRRDRIKDFINFEPSEGGLSSGENALLNLFSRFYEILEKELPKVNSNSINQLSFILLDEADLGFHPQWKKQFVSLILFFFNDCFKKLKANVQIIITTHDSLTLSDILNYNVVYLDKKSTNLVLNGSLRPSTSFGANISDLLSDSFFVEDGLIGYFSKQKIQDVIDYINNSKSSESIKNPETAKRIINCIGEPFLRDKINDMFLEKFPDFTREQEILLLEQRLKELKR